MKLEGKQEAMVKRVEATKKYKADDVEKTVKRLVKYITYFNSLDQYTTRTLNHDLGDIPVLNELKDFIYPLIVRVNVLDIRCKNLVIKTSGFSDNDINGLSFDEFLNLQMKFRGYFKSDISSNITPLADIMKPVNLFDILDHVSCSKLCKSSGDLYYPVEVDECVKHLFVDNLYFTTSESDVVDEYLNKWLS